MPYVVPSQDHVKLFAMDRGKPGNVPLCPESGFSYILRHDNQRAQAGAGYLRLREDGGALVTSASPAASARSSSS